MNQQFLCSQPSLFAQKRLEHFVPIVLQTCVFNSSLPAAPPDTTSLVFLLLNLGSIANAYQHLRQ